MKNTFRQSFYYLHLFGILVLLFGCDDFVAVDPPNSQLTTPAVFEDAATATAALTDIYAQMRENGFFTGRPNGLSCLLGAYTDELVSFETGVYTTESFYTNSLLASNTTVSSLWNNTYKQIYSANSILEGVQNSGTLNESVKNQLKGEALFIRAFLHLQLVAVFGPIPYIETTDYTQNRTAGRKSIELIYQKIVTDLEQSIELVNATYPQSGRIRPNKAAVQALLARVYLYHGDYAAASNMASAVLNNTFYVLEQDLTKEFLKQSTSTLWQFSPGATNANTYEGTTFIFFSGPPSKVSLNTSLVAQFEATDLRKTHWVKQVSNGTEVWYHSYKYTKDNLTSPSVENSIVLRLAEQYLIRAEARARQGELIGAKEDLNSIRQRAGLPDTMAVTQSELLNAILEERRLELFTEFGHRFIDLKRFGLLDSVLGSKTGWTTTDGLWPLPQTEMNANPFLVPQNPGY